MPRPYPHFRELSRTEAEEVLARNHVGRLAFVDHEQVDIEPIHYVFANGAIHGRTAAGTKLHALAHQPWVALETDEIEGLFNWRSVVVRGTVYKLDPALDEKDYAESVEIIRGLVPEALAAEDPTPSRDIVFRIYLGEISGRAADDR